MKYDEHTLTILSQEGEDTNLVLPLLILPSKQLTCFSECTSESRGIPQ